MPIVQWPYAMTDQRKTPATPLHSSIIDRVLRAIALNRQPGWHFAGNFLDIAFDAIVPARSRLSMVTGPHCADRDGNANLGAVAMLADMALATSIRALLQPETRLATVGMHLQFTGNPARGRMHAAGNFHGFVPEAKGRQGMADVMLAGDEGPVCFGTGSFMALDPPPGVTMHPVPMRNEHSAEPERIAANALKADERRLLRRAEASLATMSHGDFLSRFWGFEPAHSAGGARCTVQNGSHVGNRVGHVQGGILMGLAAVTANAALPSRWHLGSITACYVSPGVGARLQVRSKVVHRGRFTAVVRTEIIGAERKRVLEVLTTHSAADA
jgi:acyl-coenzyme A thioesterase PaaI-like protein